MTEERKPKREMRYRRKSADEGPVALPETPYVERSRQSTPEVRRTTPRRTAFWLQVIVALLVLAVVAAIIVAVVNPGGVGLGAQAPASELDIVSVASAFLAGELVAADVSDWLPMAWQVEYPEVLLLAA